MMKKNKGINVNELTQNEAFDPTYELYYPTRDRLRSETLKPFTVLLKYPIDQTLICTTDHGSFQNVSTCKICGNKPDLIFNFASYELIQKHNTQVFSRAYTFPHYTKGAGNRLYGSPFSVEEFTIQTNLKKGTTILRRKDCVDKPLFIGEEIIPTYEKSAFHDLFKGTVHDYAVNALLGNWDTAFAAFRRNYGRFHVYDDMDYVAASNPKSESLFQHKDLFNQYFKDVFPLRGIVYRQPHEFIKSKEHILSGFMLLKYPILQHLPVTVYAKLPENIRKRLRSCYTAKAVWNLVFPNCSAGVRKLIHQNEGLAALYHVYAPHITHNHNMLSFLREARPTIKAGMFMYEQKGFHEGMNLFTLQVSEEKYWIQRLTELRKTQSDWEIVQYISDIGKMHQSILMHKPDYFIHEPNIKHLHDRLARDSRRYNKGNKRIQLNQREKHYEDTFGEYSIYLPKETFELIEAGEFFNNCVASYADDAANKKCTIALLKKEGQPVVCMEIRRNKIVQAKTFGNNRPCEEHRLVINEWASRKSVFISTYDLNCSELSSNFLLTDTIGMPRMQEQMNEGIVIRDHYFFH